MSTDETFAKRIQNIMGQRVPENIPRGKYGDKTYSHIFTDIESNFIDGLKPRNSRVKGKLKNTTISYHPGAAHMNSSQVVCISFFKKFFEKTEYNKYLLDILRDMGIAIEASDEIEAAAFEYVPCNKEGTNFDFYMVLNSKYKITFEIKYTESEFGGISSDKNNPGKYDRKWDNIYRDWVKNSLYLNVDKDTFYKSHYQVNRNILYAGDGDYAVFITPRANDAPQLEEGRKYIDGMNSPYIRNIYWEDIIKSTLDRVQECDELRDYYTKFYQKYIEILE